MSGLNACKNIRIVALTVSVLFAVTAGSTAYPASRDKDIKKTVKALLDVMMEKGDFEASLSELEELNKIYPADYNILAAMGIAQYGLMNYRLAETCFDKALRERADGTEKKMLKRTVDRMRADESIFNAIEMYKDKKTRGDIIEQREIVDKLNAFHIAALNSQLKEDRGYYIFTVLPHLFWLRDNCPGMDNIYTILAQVYYNSFYYGKAAENYLAALKLDPDNPDLARALADSYVGTGDFDSARKYYDVAIKLYAGNDTLWTKSIIKKLESIKQALPDSYKDIEALIREKKYIKAARMAKERISLSAGDYIAITQLGRIYWEKGDKRQAIRLFRKASRIAPDYPTAHLFLGKAYFFEKKAEKGIREFELFKEKMEMLPDMDKETIYIYVQNLHYICYIYYTQRRYEEAMNLCFEILKTRPEDQRARYNLAVLYYVYKHNISEAYAELRKVIDIEPSTGIANRAKYYIDYMRRNPDSRLAGDFSFIYEG
jgi:tetratricopeptide (TPR) repeat protein